MNSLKESSKNDKKLLDISESINNNCNNNYIEKSQLVDEKDNNMKDLEKIEEYNNHDDNDNENNNNSMKKNSSLIEKSNEEIENKSHNDKIVRK